MIFKSQWLHQTHYKTKNAIIKVKIVKEENKFF